MTAEVASSTITIPKPEKITEETKNEIKNDVTNAVTIEVPNIVEEKVNEAIPEELRSGIDEIARRVAEHQYIKDFVNGTLDTYKDEV
jgi:hypothetical protein